MYCILKDSKVIATCDFKPSVDDLETRGEIFIEGVANIGDVYDGQKFSSPPPYVLTTEELLVNIRHKRDLLLTESDKYVLPDYPTGTLTREQWVAKVISYRQALRDFPETCDPNNPTWPTL